MSGINPFHHSFMGGVSPLPLYSHGMCLVNDSHIVIHTLHTHMEGIKQNFTAKKLSVTVGTKSSVFSKMPLSRMAKISQR